MKVVCYGDSNTFGYDPRGYWGGQYDHPWPEIVATKTGWDIINEGMNGREIPKTTVPIQADIDYLVIMLGSNDLLQSPTPKSACAKMERFLESLTLDRKKILLVAPPPFTFGQWTLDQKLIEDSITLAKYYRSLAVRLGILFADAGEWQISLAYDGVHMTEEGHRAFADKIIHFLQNNHKPSRMQPIIDRIPCVSVENMRLSDAYTIANFLPGLELMFRAAMGVFKAHHWQGSTAIVVGSGNNGGDGFALAWILKEKGFDCTVFTVSQRLSDDSTFYAPKARNTSVPIHPFEKGCLSGFSTVVDCLLGTGFSGNVRGNYRDAIEAINESVAFVISVDINSGMNGDSGLADLAVRSDLTVTIGSVKTGQVTENAGKYIKRLLCADIGIILVREEGYITEDTCPPWLDMKLIRLT